MSDVAEKNSNTSKTAWMADRLIVRNYKRCQNIDLKLGPLTVLFGPNTGGKSTLLEAVDFFARCTRDGIRHALSLFSQGVGIPTLGDTSARVEFEIFHGDKSFAASFAQKEGGRLGSAQTEARLRDAGVARWSQDTNLLEDRDGDAWLKQLPDKATDIYGSLSMACLIEFAHRQGLDHRWRDDQALGVECAKGFGRIRDFLWDARRLKCRDVDFRALRHDGSEAGPDLELRSDGGNIWSILRDLPQSGADGEQRFDRIMSYTRRAYPNFEKFRFPTSAPTRVYATVVEKELANGYPILHAADGLVQFVLVMTALFAPAERPDSHRVCLLDEPELSLHPWAQFVLAEAIREVTSEGLCQVILATHSPVLLSRFPLESLYAVQPSANGNTIRCVTEIEESKDLLSQFSVGTLYQAQLVGEQSSESMVTIEEAESDD